MTTNPNDFAYPSFGQVGGLTKREYFAAMAMQGFIACSEVSASAGRIASASVRHADHLIDVLNKEQEA